MLAYRKTAPARGASLQDIPVPSAPGPSEVLIEVAAAGICGSDLHAVEWDKSYAFMVPHLPVTLGHEFSGFVTAIGPDVTRVSVGDRVTVWPSSPCGVCENCRGGREQNCSDKRTLGLMRDGAFAPYVIAREDGVCILSGNADMEIAALTEPLCVSLRAVRTGGVERGDKVVVLGPGTIGQGIALMSQRAGAGSVIIAGFDDAPRLATCRALGFSHCYDLADPVQHRAFDAITAGADIVIEATGKPQSIHDGLAMLRNEGVLVLAGIHGENVTLDPTLLVRRKLQIRGTHGTRRQDWIDVTAALEDMGETLRAMITHRLPLCEIETGFELARHKTASKVMIHPK